MIDRKMPGLSMDSLVSSVCPGFAMQTEYDITLRQLAAQVIRIILQRESFR